MTICELSFWSIAILGAIVLRFVGSWLGRRLGARHVVAWFGALTGFSLAIILLNAAQCPETVLEDLRAGILIAGCLIYGSITALCIELILTLAEAYYRSWRFGERLDGRGWPFPPRICRRDLVVTAVVVGVVISAGYFTFAPIVNHRRAHRQVELGILKLATKRPEGLTEDQWASCVLWTWNLHCNCGFYTVFPVNELQPFADELDRKLKGDVDLGTVDWIWDEYVRHARGGDTYSDKYRPTTPERLREVDVHGWTGSELKWFIQEYQRECQKMR